MSKRPITIRRVKNAMEKAVALKGREYVYEQQPDPIYPDSDGTTCTYNVYEDGKPVAPSCIVGHVLHYLGVPLKRLARYEGTAVYGLPLGDWGVPEAVEPALRRAQVDQDEGKTWGEALDAFYEFLDPARVG